MAKSSRELQPGIAGAERRGLAPRFRRIAASSSGFNGSNRDRVVLFRTGYGDFLARPVVECRQQGFIRCIECVHLVTNHQSVLRAF